MSRKRKLIRSTQYLNSQKIELCSESDGSLSSTGSCSVHEIHFSSHKKRRTTTRASRSYLIGRVQPIERRSAVQRPLQNFYDLTRSDCRSEIRSDDDAVFRFDGEADIKSDDEADKSDDEAQLISDDEAQLISDDEADKSDDEAQPISDDEADKSDDEAQLISDDEADKSDDEAQLISDDEADKSDDEAQLISDDEADKSDHEANMGSKHSRVYDGTDGTLSDDDQYEIQAILDHRWDDKLQEEVFLVKWAGYGLEEATWEPVANLEGCPEIMERFFDSVSFQGKMSFTDRFREMTYLELRYHNTELGLGVDMQVGGKESRSKKQIIREMTRNFNLIENGQRIPKPKVKGRSSKCRSSRVQNHTSMEAPKWQVQSGENDTWSYAGLPVHSLHIGTPSSLETCFFTLLFGKRVQIVECDFPTLASGYLLPQAQFTDVTGSVKELVCVKSMQVSAAKSSWGRKKKLRFIYIITSTNSQLSSINLSDELLRIGDFSSLPTARKVSSRLTLLMSTARLKACKWLNLKASDFEVIEDQLGKDNAAMGDGCGFIPTDLCEEYFGANKTSVQIRIFAPQLGIFKGKLVRKIGIKKIQLVKSMRKVPPSTTNDDDWAAMLVCQSFPSSVAEPMQKRLLNKPVPLSSYRSTLSTMVLTLLKNLVKPLPTDDKQIVPKLLTKIGRKDNRYASDWCTVTGDSDPTCCIPEGHVFVTGFDTNLLKLSKGTEKTNKPLAIFVTRYPCTQLWDGQMLPVVSEKPDEMSMDEWFDLKSRPFGSIIFSTRGSIPLPSQIANGDLDGDYYVILWDKAFLRRIQTHDVPVCESPRNTSYNRVLGDTWLSAAQRFMLDKKTIAESRDVSKTYAAWKRACEEKGMGDPEAQRYGQAYKNALESVKHAPAGYADH